MDLERGGRRDLFEKPTLVGLSVSNNQASKQDQPIGSHALHALHRPSSLRNKEALYGPITGCFRLYS